jgi:fluoroacetyl-CoA thioesterase
LSGAVRHFWGWVLLFVGVIGLIMPIMPGWVFIIPGLIILSDYFTWARRLLDYLKETVHYEQWRGRVPFTRKPEWTMAEIPIGTIHEEGILVTSEVAVDFLGMEGARVLGTPHMIGHMERTCRNAVLPFLEKGNDTVGTEVNVKHLAASPMGSRVSFRAEVVSVEERRVNFKVEAFDEVEKIGEGTHQRAVIDVARFAERMQRKLRERAAD